MNHVTLETLETRRLMTAVYPTSQEQYLVELINRGRANPTAEATRYGIALNEGLAAGTISTAAKQPLAINPFLTDGSRKHSQWMVDTDTFSHSGSGGTSPGDRMAGAGYTFSGSWTWGENIAYRSYGGGTIAASLVEQLHRDLFVDAGVAGRGHRTNLMSGSFREIGPGIVGGTFNSWSVGMLTEDFAKSGSSVFLTGVAFNDTVTKDSFYTPGEGLGGATITARRTSDNATYTTTTWSSGGYSLAVPAGNYTVTASGGAFSSPVSSSSVVVGTENVKRDFQPGSTPARDVTAPTAMLARARIHRAAGSRYYYFAVTYSDNVAMNPTTLDNSDILVTGPGGWTRIAQFVASTPAGAASTITVEYTVKAPGGIWDSTDNGLYTIRLQAGQVKDTSGNAAAAKVLGQFAAQIPAVAMIPGYVPATFSTVPVSGDEDLVWR